MVSRTSSDWRMSARSAELSIMSATMLVIIEEVSRPKRS